MKRLIPFLLLSQLASLNGAMGGERVIESGNASRIVKREMKVRNEREKKILCELVKALVHSQLPINDCLPYNRTEYRLTVPEENGEPRCSDFIHSIIKTARPPAAERVMAVKFSSVNARLSPYNCSAPAPSISPSSVNITQLCLPGAGGPPARMLRELKSLLAVGLKNQKRRAANSNPGDQLDQLLRTLKDKTLKVMEFNEIV